MSEAATKQNGWFIFALVLAIGLSIRNCNNTESLESKVNQLSSNNELKNQKKEIENLKSELEVAKSKTKSAVLSPTDTGYSTAIDSDGRIYPVSIESAEAFPGGAQYKVGLTNIYAIGLNNVVMDITYGEEQKSISIPEIIQPGRRVIVPVSFLIKDGKYPEFFIVSVQSNGMHFLKQF